MNIITYYSAGAVPNKAWLAYVVLPNGDYWGVRFEGQTEAIAALKANEAWQNEQAKRNINTGERIDGRGHHLAGKVWMIHSVTREKVRVDSSQVTEYEFKGYEKGGPRSK